MTFDVATMRATLAAGNRWHSQRLAQDFYARCRSAADGYPGHGVDLLEITRPAYTNGRQREVYQGA